MTYNVFGGTLRLNQSIIYDVDVSYSVADHCRIKI